MDLPINRAEPIMMHIDMDSCFATIEQQANPLLRNKPIVVAAYDTYYGCILSPSIEAKRFGIKTGMRIQEAKLLYPRLIVRTPDPPKYRDVHHRFMKIFRDYSPEVVAKSIDEAILDFGYQFSGFSSQNLVNQFSVNQLALQTENRQLKTDNCPKLREQQLVLIAKEIKQRIHTEIGEWISCSIGIAPSRFWAKTGAGFNKPDGLTIVTHETIHDIFQHMKLTDICGINVRYQLRLNRYGICTPIQFLNAPLLKLQKQVFQSIAGYYWYMRLRGWEVDQTEFERKTYGQQYHLTESTDDPKELLRLLLKLCEKMGRRLREANCYARGIHVGCSYRDRTYWHHGQTFTEDLYTTHDLFHKAKRILEQQPEQKIVTKISVHCFGLHQATFFQDELFDEKKLKRFNVSKVLDQINDRYGEYVVHPALMMNMKNKILDRIAFGKAGIELSPK